MLLPPVVVDRTKIGGRVFCHSAHTHTHTPKFLGNPKQLLGFLGELWKSQSCCFWVEEPTLVQQQRNMIATQLPFY